MFYYTELTVEVHFEHRLTFENTFVFDFLEYTTKVESFCKILMALKRTVYKRHHRLLPLSALFMSNAVFPRLSMGFQCNVNAAILFIYVCDVIFMGGNSSTNKQTQKVIHR